MVVLKIEVAGKITYQIQATDCNPQSFYACRKVIILFGIECRQLSFVIFAVLWQEKKKS